MGYNVYIYNNFYVEFFHFGFVCLLFFSILFFIALGISIKRIEYEKLTPYECGFEPFETNTIFNIHFYIIGLSFLIFDLEVIFFLSLDIVCGSCQFHLFFGFIFFF